MVRRNRMQKTNNKKYYVYYFDNLEAIHRDKEQAKLDVRDFSMIMGRNPKNYRIEEV